MESNLLEEKKGVKVREKIPKREKCRPQIKEENQTEQESWGRGQQNTVTDKMGKLSTERKE